MSDRILLTHDQCQQQVMELVEAIETYCHEPYKKLTIYPVPRGGIPVAYMLQKHFKQATITTEPEKADLIVDDLVDSGATMLKYQSEHPDTPFIALYDKRVQHAGKWLVFPWELGEEDKSAHDIPTRLLQYIGEDPARGGLQETPRRMLKAWDFWTMGYSQDPKDVLKVFEDGAESVDEMVVVRDIPVYSHCEHHLAPFFGVAHVGYIPNGKIVGLSKLSRLVDVYARRLQVQERLTNQIASALMDHLQPLGAGVVIECRHMCMESRGIQRQGATTVTSSLQGAMREDEKARAEFLDLVRS